MDDTSSTSSSRSSDSPTEGFGAISPEEITQKDSTYDVSFSEGGIQPPPLAYKSKGYPCPVSPEIASSAKKCLWEVDREQVDRSLRQELSRIMQEESLVKSAKWNYDFKQEKPLMGGWTWETAKDPPKFYQGKEVGQKGSKRKREDEDASSSSGLSARVTVRNVSTAPLVMADTLQGESSSASVSSSTAGFRPLKKLCSDPPPDNSSKKSDSSTNVSCASTSIPVDSSLRPSSTSTEPSPVPSQILPLPSSTSVEPLIQPSSISSTESVVMSSSSPIELTPTGSSTALKAPSPTPSSSTLQSASVTISQTPVDVISSSGDTHLATIAPIIETTSSSSSSTSSSSNSPSSSSARNRSLSQSGVTIPTSSFYQSSVDPPPVSSSKRRKSSPGSSSSSSTTSSSHPKLNSSRSSNGGSTSSSTGSGHSRNRESSSSRRSTTSGWLKYFR